MITHNDLDTRICDYYKPASNKETFREFIRNTEKEFGMIKQNIDKMSEEQLNDYLELCDEVWTK